MTSTLTQLPRTSTLYWEAALSVMRRPGALKSLPPLSLRLLRVSSTRSGSDTPVPADHRFPP